MMSKIFHPERNDVLCGRGKFAMNWKGNLFFSTFIKINKERYSKANNQIKQQIANDVVNEIQSLSPPGRFLMLSSNEWIEISNERAIRKIRQALREGTKDANISINEETKKRAKNERFQFINGLITQEPSEYQTPISRDQTPEQSLLLNASKRQEPNGELFVMINVSFY